MPPFTRLAILSAIDVEPLHSLWIETQLGRLQPATLGRNQILQQWVHTDNASDLKRFVRFAQPLRHQSKLPVGDMRLGLLRAVFNLMRWLEGTRIQRCLDGSLRQCVV